MDVNVNVNDSSSSGNAEKTPKPVPTPSKQEKHSFLPTLPSTLPSPPPEFSLPPSSPQGTLKGIKATPQPGFFEQLKSFPSRFQSLKGKQTSSSVTEPASAAHSSASPSPLPVAMHVAPSSVTVSPPAAPSSATSPLPLVMHVEPSAVTVPTSNSKVMTILKLVKNVEAETGESYLPHDDRLRLAEIAKSQTSRKEQLLMTCLVSAEVQQLIGKPLQPIEKVELSLEEQRDPGLSSKEIEISHVKRLPGDLADVIQRKDEEWAKAVNTQLNSLINEWQRVKHNDAEGGFLNWVLSKATEDGYTELMEFFDAAGLNCPVFLDFRNQSASGRKSLLRCAIKSNNLIIVEILLKASDLNIREEWIETITRAHQGVQGDPLSYAIKHKNPMIVKILLKASNPNDFAFAFHDMIAKKNLEMVKAFIEAGIDLNDTCGARTPLEHAVESGIKYGGNNMSEVCGSVVRGNVVRALLEAGASVDDQVARNTIGITLWLIYHSRNFYEKETIIIIEDALNVLELILKGARGKGSLSSNIQQRIQEELINTVNVLITTASKHDPNFEHPFSLVLKRMVQVWLDAGADPNLGNEGSESAMSIAKENKKVLEILHKKQ